MKLHVTLDSSGRSLSLALDDSSRNYWRSLSVKRNTFDEPTLAILSHRSLEVILEAETIATTGWLVEQFLEK